MIGWTRLIEMMDEPGPWSAFWGETRRWEGEYYARVDLIGYMMGIA